ncbi:MAG: hypothetical protein ABIT08_11440 [Bacteroidia bacterium]
MSDTRHPISYETAVDYILRFITNYPNAASRSIGGYIDKPTLEIILANNDITDLYGLLFWYCCNLSEPEENEENPLPYLFLSLTDKDGFDQNNPPATPDIAHDYFRAATIHTFTGTATTETVDNYLATTDYSGSRDIMSITAGETADLLGNFLTAFPQAAAVSVSTANPCGLFIQEDSGISDLMNDDPCTGLNYFFGVTDGTEPKICVVLFPVDDNGLNATTRLIFERAYP